MGMRTLLEWKICADDPIRMAKQAFSSIYTLDKKVYDLYESAEVHTVNKVKRSKWFYALPVILLLVPIFLGLSYTMLKNYGKQHEQEQAQELAASDVNQAASEAQEQTAATAPQTGGDLTAEMFVPTLAEKPESKPIYNGVRQVKTFEYIAGCVDGGKSGCTCYSAQGTPLKEVTKAMCKDYARNGLPFNPYKDEQQASQQQQTAPQAAYTPESGQVLTMGG